jgi:two-component system, NtrC family, sensor kinase
MKIHHSLSFKIVLLLCLALVVVLSISTYYNVVMEMEYFSQAVQGCAERTSELTGRSLRYGMKMNDPSSIHATINDLGKTRGTERIRIYDKMGVIRYSSEPSEVGHIVDVDADACTICHGTGEGFSKTKTDQYVRVYQANSGHRVLGFINPIENEKECYSKCHVHTPDQTILGVLDVQLSMEVADEYTAKSRTMLIISALISLLAAAAAAGLFVYFVIHKPVQQIIAGTKAISAGELDQKLILDTKDELGDLTASFNIMAQDIKAAKTELIGWSTTLEEKVEEKSRELQEVQAQVVHIEKMASLGKLSSMIAHELNNPLSGILTYARLIHNRIENRELDEKVIGKILRDASLIADEAKRCGDIVKNLLFFARTDTGSYESTEISGTIEKCVRLVQHKADMQQVQLISQMRAENCKLVCDVNQIQQMLIALIINGIEAMPDGGTIRIITDMNNGIVEITVKDDGPGIEELVLPKIFEPFVSSKEDGHGTGLGLSIVYGIVKRHKGDIKVMSEIGKGTVFRILFPSDGPNAAPLS